MRYVMTRYGEYQKEMAYRVYVTDRLYRDSERRFLPVDVRYYDWINPQPTSKRSGDDIAMEVILKAGLVVS